MSRLFAAGLGLLVATSWAAGAKPFRAVDEPPRLVLVLAIDQLRPDRLSPSLPGGLGRLLREGRVFADAALDHADTETCPGHATMLTGRHPGAAGIPANEFFDLEQDRIVYCVEDEPERSAVFGIDASARATGIPRAAGGGEPAAGRSPRRLRVSALGDWMKAAHAESRVFSVAGKDRAAITLAGQRPDAAYWFERGAVGFTSSRHYMEAPPPWLRRFHGDDPLGSGWLARLPARWEHATGAPPNGARPDDHPAESPRYGRRTGHPLRDADARVTVERLYFTPFLDEQTLELARVLVQVERLGRGPAPDLLALGLSATDTVGHLYGPGSQEARDALLRLDGWLDELLSFLDGYVGEGRVLVVLTADHGVLDLPEWLVETGHSECPLAKGRGDAPALLRGLAQQLHDELDPPGSPVSPWILASGYALGVNRALAAERGVEIARVATRAAEYLREQPGVLRVWTAREIAAAEGPEPFARLYRHSFDPERSGDLVVQSVPTCLFSEYATGTSHGTPYLYDRAVPLVFAGPGVERGVVRGRAATVDIAPTLARSLGLELPPGLDGRALALRGSSASSQP